MKKLCILFLLLATGASLLTAQIHRNPPDYAITFIPTTVMFSWYDYMIGSYRDNPVKVVPYAQGGGVLMAFHANPGTPETRSVYLAHLNTSGNVTSLRHVSMSGSFSRYPAMDIDNVSGLGFLAWHEAVGEDLQYTVCGSFVILDNGGIDTLSTPAPIFDPVQAGGEYLWPIVKFGPSPEAGMRRIYVLSQRNNLGSIPMDTPRIAYADFNPSSVTSETVLEWSFIPVNPLQDWLSDTQYNREPFLTMLAGEDGRIYLCGNHVTTDVNTGANYDEPNLDMFICDNFGQGEWSAVSAHAEQELSCQLPGAVNQAYLNLSNSGHFNAVMGSEGIIRFPQLSAVCENANGEILVNNSLTAVRQVEYDLYTGSFRIHDLYPQGASPHSEPAYTPWDMDEDTVIDSLDTAEDAVYLSNWPFNHWDTSEAANNMFYYYNLQMMTEPNELGWMACVWQDSNRARLYNLYPDDYPQYSAYEETPEIFISLSPDNGWTWLEPVVLNNVVTPLLAGKKPMWVYPADKIIALSQTDSLANGRLYLMFFDDINWGAEAGSGVVTPQGGYVNYMAVDFTFNTTHAADPLASLPAVTLGQNYPNPVRTSTTIKYTLLSDADVVLSIYNTKGQLVRSLANLRAKAGEHTLEWNTEDNSGKKVSSGLYFYRLQAGNKILSRKLLMLR
jgi:hypothetical protein